VVAGITGALLVVPLLAVVSAGVRSLMSPDELRPENVDPLDPYHGKAGPSDPRQRRMLMGIATGIVRRRRG
jgi:hypothetical protein